MRKVPTARFGETQVINKCYWQKYMSIYKIKLDSYLIKMISSWVQDLNSCPDTMKLLQENVGEILENINEGGCFLMRLQRSGNKSKSRIVKFNINQKCMHSHGNIKRVIRHMTEWEKILACSLLNNIFTSTTREAFNKEMEQETE